MNCQDRKAETCSLMNYLVNEMSPIVMYGVDEGDAMVYSPFKEH